MSRLVAGPGTDEVGEFLGKVVRLQGAPIGGTCLVASALGFEAHAEAGPPGALAGLLAQREFVVGGGFAGAVELDEECCEGGAVFGVDAALANGFLEGGGGVGGVASGGLQAGEAEGEATVVGYCGAPFAQEGFGVCGMTGAAQ